ncbi:MAG: helix-hairpin-helix domain-containing protein [Candidatus Daviesbacteria bacterium]|nr:helix-hairpin-helix domain-containing protein [Candidatus Daviesbacteria bacterium]
MDNINWREKLNQFKIPIALSFLGLVLIIGGIFASGLNQSAGGRTKEFPKESLVENQKMISVDVSGAVKTPGVYQLKDGSRIEDAVVASGGFAETANTEYVSKYLNMAQKLSDGSKVYVPFAGEQVSGSQVGAIAKTTTLSGASAITAKVNINTATQAELETLDGIGTSRASDIISGRPYQAAEDLFNKKIVGKAVFEKIKDQIVVY